MRETSVNGGTGLLEVIWDETQAYPEARQMRPR